MGKNADSKKYDLRAYYTKHTMCGERFSGIPSIKTVSSAADGAAEAARMLTSLAESLSDSEVNYLKVTCEYFVVERLSDNDDEWKYVATGKVTELMF